MKYLCNKHAIRMMLPVAFKLHIFITLHFKKKKERNLRGRKQVCDFHPQIILIDLFID